MRVDVDHDLCEGNAKCEAAAPAVFEVGDDDLSYVVADPVPEEAEEGAQRAVRVCPRAAIRVVDE